MTLIIFTNSQGKKRTCDARCYNATGSKCNCICGGANHGVGLERAVSNNHIITKSLSQEDGATAYAVPHQLKFEDLKKS